MDLLEDESTFTLFFDLPGIDLKNLGVQVKNNTVTVCGSLSSKMKGSNTIIQKERLQGLFERVVSFPLEIEKKIRDTHYELGVLKIIVGKKIVSI
jgi:HSP20 family molecular chaperone IbpA